MLRIASQISNLRILSLQTSSVVGSVLEPILDADKFQIAAFKCDLPNSREDKYLFVEDIVDLSFEGIVIDNAEKLLTTDDLVRLKNLLEIDYKVTGKKVVTDKKRKVGKVSDYVVEDSTFRIERLYIFQSIFKDFSTAQKIIGRSSILEVTDKKIIVKDSFIEVKDKKSALNPLPQTKRS